MKIDKFYTLFSVVLFIAAPSAILAGQLGAWTTINYLNIPRSTNVAVLSRSTIIYTFGGYPYTATPTPVERATIRPDGLLTPWAIESTQMLSSRGIATGFATDSYIYAIGGENNTVNLYNVERAPINPDGTLGQWTTILSTPDTFSSSAGVKYQNFFYVIGGYTYDTILSYFIASSTIYRTTINADGSLSSWTLLTTHLNAARIGHGIISIDTTIYIQGGASVGNFYNNTVEYATVFPDGQLSAFITSTSNPIAIHAGGGLFYDGQYLNVVGGYRGGDSDFREEHALIYPDGSLGSWIMGPYLQTERFQFGYVQTQTGAYVIGGNFDITEVEYAPILGVTGIERKDWEIFE